MKYQNRRNSYNGHINIITATVFGGVILLSVGVFLSMKYFVPKVENKIQESKTQDVSLPEEKFDKSIFVDKAETIKAEAYVVYDPKTGEIVAEKNKDKVLPLASMTKVMTSILAAKTIKPENNIRVLDKDLEPEGSSGLIAGDSWNRDELIKYTLSVSSNDGARVLARASGDVLSSSGDYDTKVKTFVEYMNTLAKEYDLNTLSFKNESGLDISESVPSAVGSAIDVAKLYAKAYIEIPELFSLTTESYGQSASLSTVYNAKNTNESASTIPGLTVSKTGYTDLAEGNLGVVVEVGPGTPIVIVVMHSTKDEREQDIKRLYHLTVESMKSKNDNR